MTIAEQGIEARFEMYTKLNWGPGFERMFTGLSVRVH